MSARLLHRAWSTTATAALAAVAFCCDVHAETVIGLAIPSLGPKAGLGRQIRAAAEAVVAGRRAAAATPTEAAILVVEDDACTAAGGVAAAERLIARGAAIVLGHPCSNAAIAAAPLYARSGTVFVAVGARHPDLTDRRAGPSIFRAGGRDDAQAAETVAEFATVLLGKRLVIVDDRTAYSKALAKNIANLLSAQRLSEISRAEIVAGESQYPALIAEIKTRGTEAVYFAGFPAESEIIEMGLKTAKLTPLLIGSDTTYRPGARNAFEAMIAAEPRADEIARILAAWFATEPAPSFDARRAAFAETIGADAKGDIAGRSFRRACKNEAVCDGAARGRESLD